MKISLLKELNEMTREKDVFEQALDDADLDFELGDEEMGDEEMADDEFGDDEFADDDYEDDLEGETDLDTEELQRIADHWEQEGAEMEDDDLADAIGDELEQLEYSPKEISDGITQIMSMLGREDYLGEPGDEELGDIEGEGGAEDELDFGGEEEF